jgi:cyclase/tetracenomycin F2 cyclase
MVLRMKSENADAVATAFAEHDQGDLPGIIGVTRRTLFRFQGLYMHLIEADGDMLPELLDARKHPDFQAINRKLDNLLERYDPSSWRTLTDSMATPFYTWSAGAGRREP